MNDITTQSIFDQMAHLTKLQRLLFQALSERDGYLEGVRRSDRRIAKLRSAINRTSEEVSQ